MIILFQNVYKNKYISHGYNNVEIM